MAATSPALAGLQRGEWRAASTAAPAIGQVHFTAEFLDMSRPVSHHRSSASHHGAAQPSMAAGARRSSIGGLADGPVRRPRSGLMKIGVGKKSSSSSSSSSSHMI